MTKSLNNATIETLIEKASSYITDKDDLNKIREVYEYAKEKHQGQYRKRGEEYISHPLATAIILTTVYADTPSICAGLLHDVIEDCDTSKEEIIEAFGDEIAELVMKDISSWEGSATELVSLIKVEIQPHVITRKLNILSGRLYAEHGIYYKNNRTHDGRKIRFWKDDTETA